MEDRWAIGWLRDPGTNLATTGQSLSAACWLEAPSGRFYADPFLLERAGQMWLFCEEYRADVDKGRILVTCLEADSGWQPWEVCLEQPFHLSYPWVTTWQGETFCVPEQFQSGKLELYRARNFPFDWVAETVLLELPAVDATPFEWEGKWWMWLSADPDSAKDELHLYSAPALTGPWRAHPGNPVHVCPQLARCGGPALVREGKLLRPAQSRIHEYGDSLLFYEVTTLTEDLYAEHEVLRWLPDAAGPYPKGLHHFCQVGELLVFDGKAHVPSL